VVEVTSTDIIALIFDFDDTLAPDSTSKFLQAHGIDTARFWQEEVKPLVESGFDQPSALREFGSSLDKDFYPGLPGFFDDVQKQVLELYKNIQIEFYIISGGLFEIIWGSKIVQNYFKAVYGCHLAGDTEDGPLKYIKRTVTFTEKTRYLFEINKGLDPNDTWRNPVLVNSFRTPEERRVPLRNMIYVGDGMTDIPCFSLLKMNHGLGFGVFDPASERKTKEALEEFLQTDRVLSMHSPDYRNGADLGSLLRAAVLGRCTDIQLERAQPRRKRA
jgi:hypothetical protein